MPETAFTPPFRERAGLKIRLFGDPLLRRKATSVKQMTSLQREILSKMAQAMYEGEGIGLAAPQVGIIEAMIVVDCGTGLYKLINPKIIKKEGHQALEEGCLSVPGVCIKVKRANKIKLQAEDEFAKPLEIEAEGLLSCCLQHEIDHLKGKLIVDYASFFQRLKMKKKLEDLKKRSKNEGLSESKTKPCQLQL